MRARASGKLLVFLLVSLWWREVLTSSLPYLEFKYHKHKEMGAYLQHVNITHPFITSLYSIGQSVRKRELWVLEVSAAPKSQVGIPNVKLIGNIHGNEPVGNEMILQLIQFLTSNYPSNDTVAWLLNNTRIHFLPSLNPDGFQVADEGKCKGETGRRNFRNLDLNRNFPDAFQVNTRPPQQEMLAVIDWLHSTPFVLSAGLHGGALLADYPYDNLGPHPWVAALNLLNKSTEEPEMKEIWRRVDSGTSQERQQSLTPDNDVFVYLASLYAKTHTTMHLGEPCKPLTRVFPDGFVNGAEWFSSPGGMADYNYAFHGCLEITLEIGCCKYPKHEELPQYWAQNKEAMLEFISHVHLGVKGTVADSVTNTPISGALLKIEGRNNTFKSSDRGEFWRVLLPGEYTLQVNAHGYHPQSYPFIVQDSSDATRPTPTWLNVYLSTEPLSLSESPTSTGSPPTSEVSMTDDSINITGPGLNFTYLTDEDYHNIYLTVTLPVNEVLSSAANVTVTLTIVIRVCLLISLFMSSAL